MDNKKPQSEKSVSSSELLKRLKANIADNPVVEGEAATADEAREMDKAKLSPVKNSPAKETPTTNTPVRTETLKVSAAAADAQLEKLKSGGASLPPKGSEDKHRLSGNADLMISDLTSGGEKDASGEVRHGLYASGIFDKPSVSQPKPGDINAPDATSYKAEPKPTVYRYRTMTRTEYNRIKALKTAGLSSESGTGKAPETGKTASSKNSASKDAVSKDAAKKSGSLLDRYKTSPEFQSALKGAKNKGKVDLDARIKDAEEYAKKLPPVGQSKSAGQPSSGVDSAETAKLTKISPAVKAEPSDDKGGKLSRSEIESAIGGKPGGDFDETDMNLMIAFGMDDELKKKVGEDKAKQLEADVDKKAETIETSIAADQMNEKNRKRFEFVAQSQAKGIFKYYKGCYRGLLWRLISCVILLLITFFYENIGLLGGSLPSPVSATIFPVVHILIGMQFTVLAGALVYKPVYKGIIALFSFKPIPESVTFVTLAFTLAYEISLCFLPFSGSAAIKTYNFPMILCVFLTLLYEFFNLRREIFAFNVSASKRPKSVVAKLDKNESATENELFYKLMPDDPQFLTVKKTDFVDGFFKRSDDYPKYRGIIGIIIPVSVALSLIFFAAGWYMLGSVTDGVTTAYTTLMLTMPSMLLLSFSYPFYKAAKEAYAGGSAIIGEASLEEYASGAAITFDDREVFPSYSVKVKTVQVVGKNAIDEVMYNAACVFAKIGGPLADVLDIATLDMKKTAPVEILEIAENGIEAVVDKVHILLGKSDYMTRYNIVPINPAEDDGIESGGEVNVMYMAVNDRIAAKLYIQYIIDPDFELILKSLYKAGMCIGIRTFDPNINDRMLSARIRLSKYPVKVIKCKSSDNKDASLERFDSGIISRGSVKSLLQTLTLCEKVLHVIRTSNIVKIFAVLIAAILMGFVLMMNFGGSIASLYVALYQLFWLIPVIVITKLML